MNVIDYMDIEDLFGCLTENVEKDLKDFSDLVSLDRSLDRNIYLSKIVDGVGSEVDTYIRFFNKMDENIPVEERKPIKIYVDSIGGNLSDTFTMIDSIAMSKTPVWTIATGCVYSGGFFTFIAGHRRIAYPHSSFLYHEGSTANGADAGKFRNYADFYTKELDMLKDHTLKYTKITPEAYQEHIKDDWWMTANEAVEHGVADEIAEGLI